MAIGSDELDEELIEKPTSGIEVDDDDELDDDLDDDEEADGAGDPTPGHDMISDEVLPKT